MYAQCRKSVYIHHKALPYYSLTNILWYLCDNLEKSRSADFPYQLTSHINTIDASNNIELTYEEETDGHMAFLDTWKRTPEKCWYIGKIPLIIPKLQYPPSINQKLCTERTLLDRCEAVVTEQQDQFEEQNQIYGYKNSVIIQRKPKENQQRITPKSKSKSSSRRSKVCLKPTTNNYTLPSLHLQQEMPSVRNILSIIQSYVIAAIWNHPENMLRRWHNNSHDTTQDNSQHPIVHPKIKHVTECVYKIG